MKPGTEELSGKGISLFSLFIPIFLELMLHNVMGTVNVLILGRYSDNAVASVGVGTQILNMLSMLFSVVAMGTTVVISQNLGADNRKRASDTAVVSITVTSIFALALSLVFILLAPQCMKMMQLEEKLLPDAIQFFRIAVSFSFFHAVTYTFSAIFRSYGFAKYSTIAALMMNVINATGNYIVIMRPFEQPLTGVSGVAFSRGISQLAGFLLMVGLMYRKREALKIRNFFPVQFNLIKDVLKIGIPSGVESMSYNISQIVSTSILAILGAVSISSKIYVQNIVFYVYIIGLAIGQASAIYVGRLVGAGEFDKAYRLNGRNLKIAVGINIFASLIVIFFRNQLIQLFTDNPDIIALATVILSIDIFVEIFRAFNHIEANSLRGAGDVRFPMIVSLTSCWMVSILFSYILGIRAGLGLLGCWIAFAMDEMFRGIILFFRWRSKKWMYMALVTKPGKEAVASMKR